VGVPIDADVFGAVIGPKYGDERHTPFDETAGLEDRLAVRVQAVALANGIRLLAEVERIAFARGRGEQAIRPLKIGFLGGETRCRSANTAIKLSANCEALVEALRR